MRRREFIRGAALSGVALSLPVANAGNRLYGKPGAKVAAGAKADNRLRLIMSRAEVPVDVWEDVVEFSQVWSAVSRDSTLAAEFYSDRPGFLQRAGVREELITPRSTEEQLLLASQDPIVRRAGMKGDYAQYLGRLKDMGVFAAPSTLRKRVDELLEEDANALTTFISRSTAQPDLGGEYTSELNTLKNLLAFSPSAFSSSDGAQDEPALFVLVGAAAIAVVVVGVATYAVAAVNVSVGLNVALSVSLLVNAAVGVSGGNACMGCHGPAENRPLDVESAAIRLAQLNGNSRLLSKGLRRKVRKEIIACVYAAKEQGLIQLPKTSRKQVFDLLSTITYRMAGI